MPPKRKRAVHQRPTSTQSSFTDCPACQMKVVSYLINHHLDWDCLALVKNEGPPHIALAAETTETISKSPDGLSCNREPELHTHVIQDFEARVHYSLPVMNTQSKLHDHVSQEFETSLHNRLLLLNSTEAELGNNYHIHKLDADAEEGLLIVHPEMDFQTRYNHGIDIKPQGGSSHISTEFNLDAHSSDELGLKIHGRSPESNRGLQCSTHDVCLAGGKQSCIATSMTGIDSKLELIDDHLDNNLEEKEQIASCCDNVIPDKLDSIKGRSQSSVEASMSGLKNAKSDGWRFITASLPSKAPKGHYVVEDFISEKEEQDILCFLDTDSKNPWKPSTFNGLHIGKAYGLSTDVRKRFVRPAIYEMPKILVPVLERMRTTVPILKDFWPNETNAIDYSKPRGHWLRPHVDDRQLSGTILVNLSLCGDCRMTYERERGPRESYKVLLRRRCIQIQTGECRYSFTHSILNEDLLSPRRVSMTFRQSLSS